MLISEWHAMLLASGRTTRRAIKDNALASTTVNAFSMDILASRHDTVLMRTASQTARRGELGVLASEVRRYVHGSISATPMPDPT